MEWYAPKALPEILIVDDDQVSVMAIQRGLRKIGAALSHQVAFDGREAMDFLEARAAKGTKDPLMITLDLNMPRMSGLEFLAEIQVDKTKWHPVFVYSTSDCVSDIETAYRLGATGYIIKRSDPDAQRGALELLLKYASHCSFPKP